LIIFSGCKKDVSVDYKSYDFNSPSEIQQNPSVKQAMNNSGITIYNGNYPPSIEGEYESDGTCLSASNNFISHIGSIIQAECKFYNQSSSGSIEWSEKGSLGWGVGEGCFISWAGSYFTVWQEVNNSEGSTLIIIMSGQLLASGNIDMEGISIYVDNPPTNTVLGDWWYYEIVYNIFGSPTINETSSFVDNRDGKTYNTVKIGNQWWMAENLNYYTSSGSWCYGDYGSNCEVYGRLYDWETANSVCPYGWHLPSDVEWTVLTRIMS